MGVFLRELGLMHDIIFYFKDSGKVLACGDNKSGQSVGGAGTAMNKTPQLINFDGPPVVRIACGAEFSAFVYVSGAVWYEIVFENGLFKLVCLINFFFFDLVIA